MLLQLSDVKWLETTAIILVEDVPSQLTLRVQMTAGPMLFFEGEERVKLLAALAVEPKPPEPVSAAEPEPEPVPEPAPVPEPTPQPVPEPDGEPVEASV